MASHVPTRLLFAKSSHEIAGVIEQILRGTIGFCTWFARKWGAVVVDAVRPDTPEFVSLVFGLIKQRFLVVVNVGGDFLQEIGDEKREFGGRYAVFGDVSAKSEAQQQHLVGSARAGFVLVETLVRRGEKLGQ